MTSELIREMSERLERSGQEVEKALKAFASAVNDRLAAEGEANLAGLGNLTVRDGKAHFEASEALNQAVNYRWETAGSRVEVPGGAETGTSETLSTGEGDMPDEDKPIRKATWAPLEDVDPTSPDISGASPSAVTPPKPPAPPPAPPTPSYDPVDPLVEDLTFETLHPGVVGAGTVGAATAFDDVTATEQPPKPGGPQDAPPASTKPPPAPARTARSAGRRHRDESGRGRMLLIGLGVVVVAAALWWYWPFGGPSDPATTPSTTEAIQPGTDPVDGEAGDSTLTDPGAAGLSVEVGEGGDDEQPAAPPEEPGTAPPAATADIDPNAEGYTMIVASTLDLQAARAAADGYRSLGHPVGVLSYPDGDGALRHRVAVGQFQSVQAAESARQALSGRIPPDAWTRRIRR